MQRLARGILVFVVLFVVLVAGTLVVRSRGGHAESTGPAVSNADLHIKEVQLEEQSDGVRWQLKADQALVFEGEGKTVLRKVAVEVNERGRAWSIVGDEGDLFDASKNFEVRKNVVLTSSDGLRLETTVLRWVGGEQRLWTDVPVTIYKEGAVIHGTALNVVMGQEERTEVSGRVRATFAQREP
jgi:LPS export ABC transporter protein LptC